MQPSHLFQNSLGPDFDQGDALLVIQACALDFLEESVLDAEDILAGVDELEEEPNRLNDEAVLPIRGPGVLLLDLLNFFVLVSFRIILTQIRPEDLLSFTKELLWSEKLRALLVLVNLDLFMWAHLTEVEDAAAISWFLSADVSDWKLIIKAR